MATRWGCIGPGRIASDFFKAMTTHLSSKDHQLIAVASSNHDRGHMFEEKYGFKRVYDSYEEIVADDEVEVVYISTLNTNHVQLSKMMLNAGKHVLCEKPMAMNYQQAKEVLDLAKEKKRFFMEAVWSRFLPVYQQLRQELADKTIGEVKLLEATICVPMTDVVRIQSLDLGGGGCVDIGIYAIQSACMVFKEMPVSITAVGHLLLSGADESACVVLKYRCGGLAVLTYSVAITSNNTMVISGTKGRIEISAPFWCSTSITTPSGHWEFPIGDEDNYNFHNSGGLRYEASAVRECLLNGKLEHEYMTHQDSKMLHTIMTEVRQQLGVHYPRIE